MGKNTCLLFHKWSKWELVTVELTRRYYYNTMTIPITKRYQKRQCTRCGLVEERTYGLVWGNE